MGCVRPPASPSVGETQLIGQGRELRWQEIKDDVALHRHDFGQDPEAMQVLRQALHARPLEQAGAFTSIRIAGAEAVRYDYHHTLNRLWVRNFLQPVHAWCERHGLLFTGHFREHLWPDTRRQPDVMLAYRWMHVPGIDPLAFQFFPDDRRRTAIMLLACKEVGSVARQLRRERVLCETTGGRLRPGARSFQAAHRLLPGLRRQPA